MSSPGRLSVMIIALVAGCLTPLVPAQETPGPPIPPRCPSFPPLNLPGVLCETFDLDRNGVPGFQWSRLPLGADPNDPLRAVGDPNDDVLGYTMSGGPSPLGTAGVICSDDNLGYVGCQRPVAEENDWHLHSPFEGPGAGYTPPGQTEIGQSDGGKAHSGFRSMHMGRHLTPISSVPRDTLRLRQVSAFVLDSQGDPNVPGVVPGPSSTLEFWQIIALYDDENFGSGFIPDGTSFAGGQVQVSLLGADGRFSRWQRLTPSFNGYDSVIQETLSVCGFDPGDDQIFPYDWTMCDISPLYVEKGDVMGTDTTCLTDTDGNDPAHKDCGDISCAPGPGCTETGSLGSGVWTRSAFDLSPYNGRVARLRWIGMVEGGWSFATDRSALEPDDPPPYHYFEGDDGWFIDDIILTDLRQAPGPCVAADDDGDGFDECQGDCNDADPAAWAPPSEVDSLHASYDPNTSTLTWSWDPPAQPGGTIVSYDFLEAFPGFRPLGFGTCSCAETGDSSDTSYVQPPSGILPGYIQAFIVRARNGCPGTDVNHIGHRTDESSREAQACP